MLISQQCDLAAPMNAEPFAVVIPAGLWDPDPRVALPMGNSSRHLVIDRAERRVASYARLLPFPKSRLPDAQAEHVEVVPALLETWCARRWSRTPLPDDFVETIQRALQWALHRKGDGRGLRATLSWRADFGVVGATSEKQVQLIAVFDLVKINEADFGRYAEEIDARLRRRLPHEEARVKRVAPAFSPYQLLPIAPIRSDRLSVQDAIATPMITFDHLSPEPDESEDHPPTPELHNEDIY